MSTSVETIRMPSTESATQGRPRFTKTMKYDSSSLGMPKTMTGPTSLLDVIRTQGHTMLGAGDPLMPRRTTSSKKQSSTSLEKRRSSSSKSKPIRIAPLPYHVKPQQRDDHDEDPLSTSAELERFYDQATWRMYILIQSARVASDTAMPLTTTPAHGRVPTTPHSHAPYQTHHQRTHHHHHHPHNVEWTTTCPPQEEDIFDMEL